MIPDADPAGPRPRAAEVGVASRRTGRILAGLAAIGALGLAASIAIAEIDPVLRLYDGLWMIGGASVAFALLAPAVRPWRREAALGLIAVGVTAGAWLALAVLALRMHMPIMARLKGAIFLSSADIIGVALPVGATLGWLACREHRPEDTRG